VVELLVTCCEHPRLWPLESSTQTSCGSAVEGLSKSIVALPAFADSEVVS
jgi:hypothetical protein